jgi:hypothetical protein
VEDDALERAWDRWQRGLRANAPDPVNPTSPPQPRNPQAPRLTPQLQHMLQSRSFRDPEQVELDAIFAEFERNEQALSWL